MKPSSKYEKLVWEFHLKMAGLSPAQLAWAKHKLFEHVARVSGSRGWCSDCGGSWQLVPGEESVKCPHCGQSLKVVKTRKIKDKQTRYFTILTTYKGNQVQRTFVITRDARRDCKTKWSIYEAIQNWLSPEYKTAVIACNLRPSWFYYDAWIPGTMSIKRQRRVDSYGANYLIYGDIYPSRTYIPILKRNGYRQIRNTCPIEMMKLVLTDSRAETLIKAGQDKLLRHMYNGWSPSEIWPAVKICIRNGYKPVDASIWVDYIKLLVRFGKDIRNKAFACPSQLIKSHDRYATYLERENARKAELEKINSIMDAEPAYMESKGKFLGLEFGASGLVVKPLQSVQEFYEEGKAMSHCVFQCGYYKREDALILSARDEEGNRVATIEVNLPSLKIVQSRGVCNDVPSRNDEILRLVNTNMNKIAELV